MGWKICVQNSVAMNSKEKLMLKKQKKSSEKAVGCGA